MIEKKCLIVKTFKRNIFIKHMTDNFLFIIFSINNIIKLIENFLFFWNDFVNFYTDILFCDLDENIFDDNMKEKSIEEEIKKETPKYEDKFLEDVRKIDKKWFFSEEEIDDIQTQAEICYNENIETKKERIEEIKNEFKRLEKEIIEDNSSVNCSEVYDEDGYNILDGTTLEERNTYRHTTIKEYQKEIDEINNELQTEEGINNLKNKAYEQSEQIIIDKKMDKLKNNFVMEKTPIGNVLMLYDKNKESFKYYADSNIPYRYLEVVARKYVKTFNCRPIYVDMEEELKLFEEKWEKEQEIKKHNEEIKKNKNEIDNNIKENKEKKNVFAKLKSYNKDAGKKISMAPPKNNQNNITININNKENEKILLKEKANKYTYDGKFANFNFLQKIERKVFNKKLGMTFADFKKLNK